MEKHHRVDTTMHEASCRVLSKGHPSRTLCSGLEGRCKGSSEGSRPFSLHLDMNAYIGRSQALIIRQHPLTYCAVSYPLKISQSVSPTCSLGCSCFIVFDSNWSAATVRQLLSVVLDSLVAGDAFYFCCLCGIESPARHKVSINFLGVQHSNLQDHQQAAFQARCIVLCILPLSLTLRYRARRPFGSARTDARKGDSGLLATRKQSIKRSQCFCGRL